jgi:hypothetical protein
MTFTCRIFQHSNFHKLLMKFKKLLLLIIENSCCSCIYSDKNAKHRCSLISLIQGLCNLIIVSNEKTYQQNKTSNRMKQMKSFLGLLIIVLCLVHDYEAVENKLNNEVSLKRIRRIIRGHLATPGQVKTKYFHLIIEITIDFCISSFHIKYLLIIMEIIFVVEH